ncbi:MAG: 3-beta hydroxysteroid dehydrogenase [Candidatus Cloacimonetes bacterium 4572_55]|nr:MAG: 3-beta hydroxysteroid dehydrogenase [Candidatus Cloacimonetes bacterium 4572_55]
MEVLVTGGGGFIGRYIAEQLIARGDTVSIFARGDYPELKKIGIRSIRGDLTDSEAIRQACAGMDIVYHIAAKPGVWGSWESFYQPNVIGTENMIAACRSQKVPKLIFTSSPSVVFGNRSHEGVDESVPYPKKYENFYSHTKAIAEQKIIQANDANLLTVSLRPHLVIGPRDPHLIPRLIQRAISGKLIQVGNGENRIDLTYVEDAARAHLLAADSLRPGSPTAGSVYFISQGEPVNLWEWIQELLNKLGLPPIKRKISLSAARMIGASMEFGYGLFRIKGEPRMTRFLACELAMSHYYDISRAKQDFGFEPRFSMKEAVDKLLASLELKM